MKACHRPRSRNRAGRGNTACIMSEREARHRRVYDQLWDPCRVLEKMGVDPDNGP